MVSFHGSRKVAIVGTILGACLLAGAPSSARADAQDLADAEVTRISAAGHSLEWNWVPPGYPERYGHAETLIHAPLASVRGHVLDFPHYRNILPDKFQVSRVVGHGPDQSTDVYIQIAVLHGVVTLWDVARFAPLKEVSPGVEFVEGRMVRGKGNVDDMHVMWTMRAINDEWTLLKFDMLLKPGLPVPQSSIDEELRDSARHAVDSIHDRAQGTKDFEAWPGSG